jgi:raffinose/stachyose/melibiose transport system permease protein
MAKLALILLLLFVAVGSAAEPTIVLDVPIHSSGEVLKLYKQAARDYEAARHGEVVVQLEGDPRVNERVQVRLLEGSPPEIIDSVNNLWALIEGGRILELDEFLDGPNWEGDGRWRDSFLTGSLDRYTIGGKAYGVPLLYFIHTLWYDKNLFEKHGWEVPRTWEELYALCDRIKAAGIAPIAFQGRYPYMCQRLIDSAYYHMAGNDRFNAQKSLTPGEHDNPQLAEALRHVQVLGTKYFQPGAMGMSHTEAQMQFFLGRCAMISSGSWLRNEMEGKIPEGFRLGTFLYPIPGSTVSDPTAVLASGGYFWVLKDSPRARESVDFLRYLTSREVAARFAQDNLPVAIRGVNQMHLSPDMADLAGILEQARTSFGDVAGERYPEMFQYWIDLHPGLLNGGISPQQMSQQLEQQAQLLRQNAADPNRVEHRHFVKPLLLLGAFVIAAGYALWTVVRSSRRQLRAARSIQPTAGRRRMAFSSLMVFLGPAVLLYTLFVIVPSARALGWCAYRWDGLGEASFIGWQNFHRLLFESDGFWIALSNNLFIMLVIPAFVIPLSLIVAAALNRRVKGAGILRIVLFFPSIMGGVAVSLLWMHLYNPQGGIVNRVLAGMGSAFSWAGLNTIGSWFAGFDGYAWLAQENLYGSLIPMSIWGACGFNMILFLAAMQQIPQEMYEAAELDGAGPARQFWTITLPLIRDVITIAVVFMAIGGMKAFETIWLLTSQMPSTSSHVIGTRMVQTMFSEFKVGEATAIAVLLLSMVLLVSAVLLRGGTRRETLEF